MNEECKFVALLFTILFYKIVFKFKFRNQIGCV